MFEELEATVSGKVQGVMYRDFVQKTADTLGLVGCVENRRDGTVRVVAQGMPDALKAFAERLNEGSVLAHVTEVAVTRRDPSAHFDEFSVRH